MSSKKLCLNCLRDDAVSVPVGGTSSYGLYDNGSGYEKTIDLCGQCRDALLAGNFVVLHDLFRTERLVQRG